MEFIDLIYDLILEEFKDKNLLQTYLRKWFGENPTEQDEILCDFLLEKYFAKKAEFSLNKVEIKVFLQYYKDFKPDDLKKLSSFSLEQMKFLVGEFYDLPTNLDLQKNDDILFNPMFKSENISRDEKVNLSKNIWYTETSNCIVNEDGFRVYYIPNKQASQNFGYYMTAQPRSNQWCVTKPGTSFYENYRKNRDRTFYFVIDESKNPNIEPDPAINKYYLSAVQPSSQSSKGYFITNIENYGDEEFSQSQIISLYPKLDGKMDKLVSVPYNEKSEDTDGHADPIDDINEIPGPNEFAKQPKTYKSAYIARGGVISKAHSWEHMTPTLRNDYINLTLSNDFLMRFNSLELLDAIKKNKEDYKTFIARAKRLSVDTNKYVLDLVKNRYDTHRININNNSLVIIKDKQTKKIGIFDTRTLDFFEKDGVRYSCEYQPLKPSVAKDKNGKTYFVESFGVGNVLDERAFYSLYETKNPKYSLIISYHRFNQLVNDGKIIANKTPIDIGDVDPEHDFDIKEIYE
jgi:hypothetical protein